MSGVFEGTYSTNFGPVTMLQTGREVIGDYGDRGMIEGTIQPDGRTLDGTFINGARRGRFSFFRTSDGFDGEYAWGLRAPSRPWDGQRVNRDRPALSNAYYEGTYETDHGPVRLHQEGSAVWGDYKGVGTIDAQFDEGSGLIRGTFTNGGKKGRIEWQLRDGGFRGRWAWGEARPEHRWNGTKTSWSKPTLETYPTKDIVNGREDRALLVISSLKIGSSQYLRLYDFLDAQGISQAMDKLSPVYGTIAALRDSAASKRNILNTLRKFATDTSIREIDLILHCHGLKNGTIRIGQDDGSGFEDVSGKDLRDDLKALGIADRLRMVYSTACYGAMIAQDFVDGGFTCACGAKAVNANSGTEYPDFLNRWKRGEGYRWSVDQAFNPVMTGVAETVARNVMGFNDVDSKKVIKGNSTININSEQETRGAAAR